MPLRFDAEILLPPDSPINFYAFIAETINFFCFFILSHFLFVVKNFPKK